MKTMVAHFGNDFKDIEIVSQPLDIKSSLKEEDIPLIEKWQTISKHPSMHKKSRSIIIYLLKAVLRDGFLKPMKL